MKIDFNKKKYSFMKEEKNNNLIIKYTKFC